MKSYLANIVQQLQNGILYATCIAILALFSLALLAFEVWYGDVRPDWVVVTQRLDIAIAWIFLTDFFAGLIFNTSVSRSMYWKQNWLNLVSSIPISSEATRVLRVLRVLRALRVIRAGVNFYFARQRVRRNRYRHSRG